MESKVSWIKNDSIYNRVEGDVDNVKVIPVGIYNVEVSRSGWYLERVSDKFVFGYKIYGIQNEFIEHVLKIYENTTSNLGILLNGIRGTGKSVTAKIIANKLNLPVIIVKSFDDRNQELVEFLSSFNFDCVLFFDEFEKQFSSEDFSLLQIMDGVYTSKYRKVFLLTTNSTNINENMISRPSRIRYIREFGNLEEEVIREFLKDNLIDKSNIDDIVKFVDTLEISTMDILKTIVEEINIFGFSKFTKSKEFFNIRTAFYEYKCLRVAGYRDGSLCNYSVNDFIKDINSFKLIQEKGSSLSEEELDKFMKDNSIIMKHCPSIRYYNRISKPLKYLNAGDIIANENQTIIYVDKEKQIFIAQENGDSGFLYYNYVTNPNSKPSIFKRSFDIPLELTL